MCVRFSPITKAEAEAIVSAMHSQGRAPAPPDGDRLDPIHDAYPGAQVPLFVSDSAGRLQVACLTWGFPFDGKANAVFNTRIESALEQLRRGRRGMWAKAIRDGRCLVPVRAFYEAHATERIVNEETGKAVRRQYRFRMPGARVFLLAGVQLDGCFSIVTTEPNASVAPIHDRMPLVLGPGESKIWIRQGFTELADRSPIALVPEAEQSRDLNA